MNAIFSLDTVTSSGGGQVILRTLAKSSEQTILFCPPGSLATEASRYCKVVYLPQKVSSLFAIPAIRALVARYAPFDVFHIHGISALSSGILSSEGFTKQRVYTEHLLTKHYKLESPLHYWVQILFYKQFIKRIDHIYCVSAAVMQFLRESLHVSASKLTIAYNPVPKLERTHTREQHATRFVRVVSIGNLTYIKNYAKLLHIISKIPAKERIRVTVFGNGPEKNDLISLAAHLGLTKTVNFVGALPHDRLLKSLLSADIYVQTSVSESFGYGVAEAMQVGLPVIAFAVGGIPELVQDEYSGKLIPPYNEQKFTEAIQSLVEDKKYREQLGRNAKKSIARYET